MWPVSPSCADCKRYVKMYVTDIYYTHPCSIVYSHLISNMMWKRTANTIYLSGVKSCLLVRYPTVSTIELIVSVYFISCNDWNVWLKHAHTSYLKFVCVLLSFVDIATTTNRSHYRQLVCVCVCVWIFTISFAPNRNRNTPCEVSTKWMHAILAKCMAAYFGRFCIQRYSLIRWFIRAT